MRLFICRYFVLHCIHGLLFYGNVMTDRRIFDLEAGINYQKVSNNNEYLFKSSDLSAVMLCVSSYEFIFNLLQNHVPLCRL